MTTVLVVEDEHNIATVVRIALERDGHRVVVVRTGEEALAELPRHRVGRLPLSLHRAGGLERHRPGVGRGLSGVRSRAIRESDDGLSRPAEGRVRQSTA
jgi:CheY-like chemotaxis protein